MRSSRGYREDKSYFFKIYLRKFESHFIQFGATRVKSSMYKKDIHILSVLDVHKKRVYRVLSTF